MFGKAFLKFFNHVKVVLSDFAPRTWHNFTSLHDKHILAGFGAKPVGLKNCLLLTIAA
jgi:hypothetical protein